MNYKLEKFWNYICKFTNQFFLKMNYKLEKFWNINFCVSLVISSAMNYKLEKFWNHIKGNEQGEKR